jgi:hypothetical protein
MKMSGHYMTVGEFVELFLGGEVTIERLKRFGNKLDEFSQGCRQRDGYQ